MVSYSTDADLCKDCTVSKMMFSFVSLELQ